MASGSSLKQAKINHRNSGINSKRQAKITADLVIEDDIDTELSVAALGGSRWQHQQQLGQQQQQHRITSSHGRKPTAPAGSSRLGASGDAIPASFGSRISNRTETELDSVQFPPVRRGQAGSSLPKTTSSPATTSPSPSNSASTKSTPELLPPLVAADIISANKKIDADSSIATKSTNTTANDDNKPANEAPVALKQPPAKLSLDRPWWKSVDKQQQNQLLEALPAPPKPPQASQTLKPQPSAPATVEALETVKDAAVNLVAPSSKPATTAAAKLWIREPITEKQIESLRVALFGSGDSRFSPDWASQGFHFGFDLMPYLLTSSKQEPRSALCAVQAELLRQLLFTEASANPTNPASKIGGNNLEPTIRLKRLAGPAQRSAALARAFSSIVARCGDSVKLVLPNSKGISYIDSLSYVKDGLSEKLDVYTSQPGCNVVQFLLENIRCFESQRTPSLVLLIYSCLLSLGVDRPAYKPPDGSPWPLIGPENLANQSLLLLLLCGSPVSQVCNHYSDEAAPNGSVLRLAGVPNRCDVGLLSSREFSTRRNAQPYQIGSFLKSPRAPIWLLELQTGQQQQQQQYVVAFACDSKLVSDWRAERLFELLLLTPVLRSRAPGKATIDCRGNFSDQNSSSSSAASSAASLRESADTSESPLAPEGERNSSMGIELPPTAEVSPVEMCLRSK
ncbi:hypothetical protein BOX15_Mlig017537g1 [Macrostomum lignano]|uniref:Ubiquitin carboxyl-terminal hydrolase MINDY n=1 Tax=Macrostomum lignano TaxID=282301 RepID=A0A267FH36_9PLAT|nr:hypothetical protein BOX15_Mlig017537g1 [Macrostomum lignano]